ncbi:terminase [Streptomyces sp. SID3212]|uniref:terminase n=1 Tax=Streptomyces sp. SID3212 TaxID=2690259 RepID=UPI00136C2B60|nr:terminase [Streptomyces sp. SID3212]MYV56514.1 terminase [Streptomyces sp. SID3212]
MPGPAEPTVYGSQEPRIRTAPADSITSAGQEAVELAAQAGLHLDPWQQLVLHEGMGEKPGGGWSAFEVCTNVPRQNGKGGIIEARELWGLFLGGERMILHSAHQFKTSKVAFRRIVGLITNCDDLRKRVKAVRYTTGEESIELLDGAILQFLARSGGSGRGFTGDCNIMDEAMYLGRDAMSALMFTMAAIADPQLWYFGSAGVGSPSVQLARLRRRALEALEFGRPDPSLAYFEWSIDQHRDECPPDCAEHDDPESPEAVLRANPGVGYRLTLEKSMNERLSVSPEDYARERLGVGEYPSDVEDTWRVIPEDTWRALGDGTSVPSDPVAFAVDTTPERSHSAITVAGPSGDAVHVEVVDHRPGTGWVVTRLVDLVEKWRPCAVVIDAGGPAASLIPALRKALVEKKLDQVGGRDLLVEMKTREVVAAAGQFYDAVIEQGIVHLDQAPLATALAGADKRPVGEGWAWARRGVTVDISPLVSATHAAWGYAERAHVEPEGAPNLW